MLSSAWGSDYTGFTVSDGKLHLDGQGGVDIASSIYLSSLSSATSSYCLYYNSSTKLITYGAAPSVSGTASYLPKFATATTLGNSVIYEDSSHYIGVNTISPTRNLDVNGNLRIRTIAADTSDSTQILTADSSGNVNYKSFSTFLGYTLQATSLVLASPADATTYYFGGIGRAIGTTGGISRIYIPKAGKISAVYVYGYSSTAGTSESWTMNLRVNNTTDYTISSTALAANSRVWSNTAMSVHVMAGDYIEIKTTTPTWSTNPANLLLDAVVYIENDPAYILVPEDGDTLEFDYTGTACLSDSIGISSNSSWTISSNASWLTTSVASGSGNSTVYLTCTSNSGSARTATITITGANQTKYVYVSQYDNGITCL